MKKYKEYIDSVSPPPALHDKIMGQLSRKDAIRRKYRRGSTPFDNSGSLFGRHAGVPVLSAGAYAV